MLVGLTRYSRDQRFVVVRDNWGFLLVMAAGSIVGAANLHYCITAQLALKQSHIEPEKNYSSEQKGAIMSGAIGHVTSERPRAFGAMDFCPHNCPRS
jgi:hypothetical protein